MDEITTKFEQKIKHEKCPIHFKETDGKLDLGKTGIKKPFDAHNAIKHLTSTGEQQLACEIINRGVAAMPIGSSAERMNITLQTLADGEPKDTTEARLLLQAQALYSHGMRYLRKGGDSDMLYHAEYFMKNATKLLRLHNETIEALNRYRRGGEQKVIVQHVQISDGGKAIVGQMIAGGASKNSCEDTP